MTKKWVNVAVVGAGRIYQDAHRDAYVNKTSTENVLIGICDWDEKRAKEEEAWIRKKYEKNVKKAKKKNTELAEMFQFALDHLKVYTDFSKMLDDLEGDLDVVDNCTHGRYHIPLSIEAMEHGYHAMAEKPPGLNWLDVKRVVEAEKKTGKFFQLNENVCYERPTQKTREVITSGQLGQIKHIKVQFGHGGPYIPFVIGESGLPHFIDPLLSGGGCLQDLAPHGISKAFWPIGNHSKVVSCSTKILERKKNPRVMSGKSFESPVDDWVEADLVLFDPRTNTNYTMNATTSWCGSFSDPFRIDGELGSLNVGKNPKTKKYGPVITDKEGKDQYFDASEDTWEPHKGHTREIQIFCHNILNNQPSDTPAEYALRLEEILSIQFFSKLKGKEVTLEEMEAWGEEMSKKYPDPQECIDEVAKAFCRSVDLK